ncbi:hypothetical protein [Buchnera aphidicola]
MKTELLLLYAFRIQLVENVIKPDLTKVYTVIGIRHNCSSLSY